MLKLTGIIILFSLLFAHKALALDYETMSDVELRNMTTSQKHDFVKEKQKTLFVDGEKPLKCFFYLDAEDVQKMDAEAKAMTTVFDKLCRLGKRDLAQTELETYGENLKVQKFYRQIRKCKEYLKGTALALTEATSHKDVKTHICESLKY